jgi:glycosyltransferase involved in cell wall biosynthesis
MRIALLGTRGIPAAYGGFETFAEELSTRLAARGHQVTVWCRTRHSEPDYRGVALRYLPAPRHKYLETLGHTFLATLDLLRRRPDAALYCNAANALFTWLPRLFGVPVALNVDGLERRRQKWNSLARLWYRLSERLATILPNAIVTDAREIERYYLDTYRKASTFIPYGAPTGPVPSGGALAALALESRQYFLYVSRFEPENNALLVRAAFEHVETGFRLALVGDAPYAAAYIARVKDTRDPRIVLPGAIYGARYHELQANSYAYIHATEVGGTHPALLEAMGRGALVVYLDTPENREVAGGAGLPFDHHNLAAVLARALALGPAERESLCNAALERVRRDYSWDAVTDAYEALLARLAGIRL